MQRLADTLIFSPSDLNHFLECEHLITLERGRDDSRPRVPDPHTELLAQKGLEHERAWFERFRADGRTIVSVDPEGNDRAWQARAAKTLAAMQSSADVIYQGVFHDDVWHGVSDFLVRVDAPSRLGAWSYEAWDTKLARHSKPYFILQLCFYTEQLGILQGIEPRDMHVVLGTGHRESFAYREFSAYYRRVRQRFLDVVLSDRPTAPYPVAHCSLCEHEKTCADHWQAEDHLSLVAGIRRDQVQRLNEAGVRTVAQLGGFDAKSRIGIGAMALQRLVHQAALQNHHRETAQHRYDLLPLDERTGFRLLPAPSDGDIFFDMEGYPFFEPPGGLEYLFGVVTVDDGTLRFRAFHASNRAEEKVAFERFIDFVQDRLRRWPDMHVYHYAAYEPSTLKRLMGQHATRGDELDDLLRREVFVDLYQVVRQSLRISHPSYSIKKVRTFFMSGAGQGAVADGGDSILEFERWLRTREPSVLEAIVRYNEEDCVSTVRLRDWLLERKREAERAAGIEVPWKTTKPSTLKEDRIEEDEEIRRRREALLALGTPSSTLMSHLLDYHRREDKPAYWAYFDRQKKSLDDLLDDTEAIAYLEPVPGMEPEKDKRSLVHTVRFPDQEYKLGPDKDIEDPFLKVGVGTIAWIDSDKCQLGLKREARRNEPLPSAIVLGAPPKTKAQRRAICRVADAILDHRADYPAVQSLLARGLPRLRGRVAGALIQTLDLAEQKAIVSALDDSYLFIQGPPGSGKTWTGARLIVSLIAFGKRVGVAANSHKAIHNLLEEVEAVAVEEGVTFRGLKKRSKGEESTFEGRFITSTSSNEDCETFEGQLIAGTSWLFAREGMEQRLDYLFVDEAGQVSLADTVAMGTSARNLVLLGDPQQLPQVTQGVHPEGSGCSVLEHLLGGESTVAENRGLFLARSWRMHPDVCAFISELSYDGRLSSADGCERQRIDSSGLSGTGLRYFAVDHEGNAQQSPEEARLVAEQIRLLLDGGTFTDSQGRSRPLTKADILVVAPYNMQVRCLREALPAGVQVGTVDKFQGREAPVVFFSMASSTGEDVPRGLDFLFSRNRFNVAVSRAKALTVLVCSSRLLDTRCRTIGQMQLVNGVCQFVEAATAR
jgi:predicted RecB family nuclease